MCLQTPVLTRRESGRREQRVDGDNFLQQRCDSTERVPEDWGQVGEILALLAQLQQRRFALLRHGQVQHVAVESRGEGACARHAASARGRELLLLLLLLLLLQLLLLRGCAWGRSQCCSAAHNGAAHDKDSSG